MKQIDEIKWTIPFTFHPRQGHNFVINLGAIREVSHFRKYKCALYGCKRKHVSTINRSDVLVVLTEEFFLLCCRCNGNSGSILYAPGCVLEWAVY